jgi:hypothetical protein
LLRLPSLNAAYFIHATDGTMSAMIPAALLSVFPN